MFKKLLDFINKIKFKYSECKLRKVCSTLEISEKGKCLIRYLNDIAEGKETYIEDYEAVLRPLLEDGYDRVEAAKFQLGLFTILGAYGMEGFDDTNLL